MAGIDWSDPYNRYLQRTYGYNESWLPPCATTGRRGSMPDTEQIIQTAIDEWATIQGGPQSGGPTLAHYIATKLVDESVDLRVETFEFLRQADRRAEGCGDDDAYHSARHALVMVLSEGTIGRLALAPKPGADGEPF